MRHTFDGVGAQLNRAEAGQRAIQSPESVHGPSSFLNIQARSVSPKEGPHWGSGNRDDIHRRKRRHGYFFFTAVCFLVDQQRLFANLKRRNGKRNLVQLTDVSGRALRQCRC